ncbi:MAG: hypothetical protein CMI62_14200 [Parvibaculum sp.]|uniref:hypothetical protein n=1 Tax=Parvibaculum sp. TaxID=2024848 RepID=UPI000C66373E|nr:hypothetical protein [Parvibaculum sp.]MAU61870.1 hypothetical protein [Parvibaculum sp.]
MNRIAPALLFCLLAIGAMPGRAHAECDTQGPINTCLDETPVFSEDEGEVYERLDGGSYGGRPAETKAGKTITIGDTTVTLGQTEEENQPWQPFNRQFGDYDSLAREDPPRESGNPMQFKCYADGCY